MSRKSGRTGDIDHSSENSEHVQSGTVTTATLPGHRRMPRTANAPSRRGGLSKGGDAVGAAVMEGSFSASPEGSPASTEVLSSDATSPAAALIGTEGIASAAAAALSVPGAQNVLAGIKSIFLIEETAKETAATSPKEDDGSSARRRGAHPPAASAMSGGAGGAGDADLGPFPGDEGAELRLLFLETSVGSVSCWLVLRCDAQRAGETA
ncbi:uncharacterized protein LOC144108592 [Amblyomma americanum]